MFDFKTVKKLSSKQKPDTFQIKNENNAEDGGSKQRSHEDYLFQQINPAGSAIRPLSEWDEFENLIEGDEQANNLVGTPANDSIFGHWGNDTMWGMDGNDDIEDWDPIDQGFDDDHPSDDDLIFGGDGDDSISTMRGSDTVFGGEGRDHIFSQRNESWLYGGPGADVIRKVNGGSRIFGGRGNDMITLSGQGGINVVSGGAGADLIMFQRSSRRFPTRITVTDLERSDTIRLDGYNSEVLDIHRVDNDIVIEHTGTSERLFVLQGIGDQINDWRLFDNQPPRNADTLPYVEFAYVGF